MPGSFFQRPSTPILSPSRYARGRCAPPPSPLGVTAFPPTRGRCAPPYSPSAGCRPGHNKKDFRSIGPKPTENGPSGPTDLSEDTDLKTDTTFFLKPMVPNNFALMKFLPNGPPWGTLCSARPLSGPRGRAGGRPPGRHPPYHVRWARPRPPAKVSGRYLQRCANA